MNKKRLLPIIGLTLVALGLVLFIISPYLVKGLPFEYGGDLKPTYFPYYMEFRTLIGQFIKNRELPFYSWNLFLGNNFWASKSFYMLGDIYYYFSLLFNVHFYEIFKLQTIIKLVISSLSMFALLKYLKSSNIVAITLALCFGFSSWVIFFLGQPMFVSAYSFTPLFFLAVEMYLKEKKLTLFIISTSLLLLTNYYMFFSLSFFTPFYFIARYYSVREGYKDFIKDTLLLIGVYLIAVLTTMVLILPSLLNILQNDRVGTFYFALVFDQPEIYFHQLQALFVPSQNIIYQDYNVFETGSHVTRELCLWAGSITSILLPQFITDKDKYYRNSMIGLYSFMILLLIIPSGNMMILGFSSPSFRWTYLFIIVNLINASRYLTQTHLINFRNLTTSLIVIAVILVFNVPLSLIVTGKLNQFSDNIGLFYLSMVSLVVFVTLYLLIKLNKKWLMISILVLTIVQLAAHNIWLIGFIRLNENSTWEFVNKATHVLQENPNDLNRYFESLDPDNYSEFYRVYVPHDSLYWSYSHNHNLHYQLKGLMTYDSTYAPSFNDMKKLAPSVKDFESDWIFNIKDAEIINFLSTKYAIVVSADELPHSNFKLIQENYQGSLLVYENLDYTSVGELYTSVVNFDYLMKLPEVDRLPFLNKSIIAKPENVEEIKTLLGNTTGELEHIDYHNNYFYGDITTSVKGFMILKIPYDAGWEVKVNGNVVKTYQVNGGFIGIQVDNGYNEIVMNFIPEGFKAGLILSIIGVILSAGIIVYDVRRTKKRGVQL
ncbi:MAG TPA: YfhO family protein [Erysipelotrichaceae bacterium]|nr:YfhO family protein [Erysipelotrichaceae bacterium]